MAADHLGRDLPDHVLQSEATPFLPQDDQKEDLKEEVSQLLPEFDRGTGTDGVQNLISLAQQLASHLLFRLHPIPGATFRTAEGSDQGQETCYV